MALFTSDNAISRWIEPDGEYAVSVERDPICPAGDWYSGKNAARNKLGDWFGDKSVLESEHYQEAVEYNGETFFGVAKDQQEARDIATVFAHWAESSVYEVGFQPPNDSGPAITSDVYTKDGEPPTLDEVKEILGRTDIQIEHFEGSTQQDLDRHRAAIRRMNELAAKFEGPQELAGPGGHALAAAFAKEIRDALGELSA